MIGRLKNICREFFSEDNMPKLLDPLYRRTLRSDKKIDYAILAAIGLVPILIAYLIGADQDIPLLKADGQPYTDTDGKKVIFAGYFGQINWLQFIVSLPLALFLIRHFAHIAFEAPNSIMKNGAEPAFIHPLLERIEAKAARKNVRRRLWHAVQDGRIFLCTIMLSLVINLIDIIEIVQIYLSHDPASPYAPPREADWTVMCTIPNGDLSCPANIALVIPAYFLQFLAASLAILFFLLAIRFSFFYLHLIYVRHRPNPFPESEYILLSFEHNDGRFGLIRCNKIFNFQVFGVCLASVFLIMSRWENVDFAQSEDDIRQILGSGESAKIGLQISFRDFLKLLNIISDLFSFHDVGQGLIQAIYLICAALIFSPSFLKLIPFFKAETRTGGAMKYLQTFIPPSNKFGGDIKDIKKKDVDDLAKQFKENAFWPAGDFAARVLVFIIIFSLLLVLFPLGFSIDDWGVMSIYFGITGSIAAFLSYSYFVAFRFCLKWVDPRLA